ncbi:phage baseplate assembly protein [Proteus mirabilis]|uniref:phage baseplate assembly protein n=2 Tax=Proteus mirabilis TaxID=584 RepID=UPI0018C54112|nr:phage tail protein [Proteus mirabilis]EKV9967337.1 phage tail protein [Proteus mirabilis]MBG2994273.1 phage tail protein [Proteus mirabilis]MBG3001922.1 phage tail protein [Proteus mirabilis]MBI6330233.1 phage tail protein [Proteus mirabilis]MBI6483445.1 phage tail protein [Proteus mirabilis]
MLMPDNTELKDKITLLIGGTAHSDWQTYRIDNDFLKAADAWQLSLGLPDGYFPADAVRGAPVKVKMNDDVVLSGRVDAVVRDISRRGITLSLSGRDDSAILVDCAAPIFSARQLSLDEVIASIVRPLGIKKIRIQAKGVTRNDRVHIEPGERAWDSLMKAAAGRGLHPWFEPDGTLIIGGPDYTQPPVAHLIMRRDGQGNNLISLSDSRHIQGCFSELMILAQSHATTTSNKKLPIKPVELAAPSDKTPKVYTATYDATDNDTAAISSASGQHRLKIKVVDPTVPYYRPQILTSGDVDNQEQLQYRAKKAMADARLSGLDIVAEVYGHRTPEGQLWTPGQRVHIQSELHGIDDIFFLMGRTFIGGRPGGAVTQLRFKEDAVWIPDAFPTQKRQYRSKGKGKDQIKPVDLPAQTGQ